MNIDFQTIERVKLLVKAGGGQTSLAHKLGFDSHKGRQRVQAWLSDGKIPLAIVVQYDKLFKKLVKRYEKESTNGS